MTLFRRVLEPGKLRKLRAAFLYIGNARICRVRNGLEKPPAVRHMFRRG